MLKKFSLILGLALLLSLALVSQAIAAPSVSVSGKYTGTLIMSSTLVEVGVALTDNWAVMFEAGASVFPPGFFSGAIGIRYYFTAEGFRPFISLYGGVLSPQFAAAYLYGTGTVGLEYLADNGFRIAGEAGAVYGTFVPVVIGTWGMSLGYAF